MSYPTGINRKKIKREKNCGKIGDASPTGYASSMHTGNRNQVAGVEYPIKVWNLKWFDT